MDELTGRRTEGTNDCFILDKKHADKWFWVILDEEIKVCDLCTTTWRILAHFAMSSCLN